MKALLGPVACQGCGRTVAWFRNYWSDDAGASVHRCRERQDVATACACGGSIVIRDGDVEGGVRRHNETMTHVRWRKARAA